MIRVVERGYATLLAAVALLLVACVTGAVLVAGRYRAEISRVQGAADLAALAGAQAVAAGRQACPAAGWSADANRTRLLSCSAAGDDIDFVVTARVRGELRLALWPDPMPFEAQAYAGVLEDSP